ncbi:MAG: DNA repair protein RecO [Alphaproteobacteria bacterium]|jgi:DNA repair protein RecO|tara:strand:- start:1843 stop:2478 length:636 start_codon:yes stop_codon:yes gene_type:complete
MIRTRGLITKVSPYKDNHLIINIYSQEHGKKSLIVFGGQSKKKRSSVIVGSINNFEFNKDDNVCKLTDVELSHNWFIYNKYQLKLIDYSCYIIDRLLFIEDDSSLVMESYEDLIHKLNNKEDYMISFFILELNILKSSGYEPNLSYSIISKILPVDPYKDQDLTLLFDLVYKNMEFQLIFFNFLGKIMERVLQNLNIKIPLSRNQIFEKPN